MNTQKPTEAVDVRELIAHLKGIFSMSLRDFGLSASYSDAAANHVLTGISAAGYVIVPTNVIDEAHSLLCWTHQHEIKEMPKVVAGLCPWRVWHLNPDVVVHMNAGERSLYDALMALASAAEKGE